MSRTRDRPSVITLKIQFLIAPQYARCSVHHILLNLIVQITFCDLIFQLSVALYQFPLTSKTLPQHTVLKHPQSFFFP